MRRGQAVERLHYTIFRFTRNQPSHQFVDIANRFNRKPKTENLKRYQEAGDEGFWLDNQGNKRKHNCQDQKQIWSQGILGKIHWLN
jgi:hypothetical protein